MVRLIPGSLFFAIFTIPLAFAANCHPSPLNSGLTSDNFYEVASQFCGEQPSSNVLLQVVGTGGSDENYTTKTVQANSGGSSWADCQVNASGGLLGSIEILTPKRIFLISFFAIGCFQ